MDGLQRLPGVALHTDPASITATVYVSCHKLSGRLQHLHICLQKMYCSTCGTMSCSLLRLRLAEEGSKSHFSHQACCSLFESFTKPPSAAPMILSTASDKSLNACSAPKQLHLSGWICKRHNKCPCLSTCCVLINEQEWTLLLRMRK